MDAKRIIILVVLLAALGYVGQRACKKWNQYHPKPPTPATTQP